MMTLRPPASASPKNSQIFLPIAVGLIATFVHSSLVIPKAVQVRGWVGPFLSYPPVYLSTMNMMNATENMAPTMLPIIKQNLTSAQANRAALDLSRAERFETAKPAM